MNKLGARSRNAAEKELRRTQILNAALAEFQEKGIENATMSSIARRAGQSRGLVNFYFGDKAGLYNVLEAEALAELGRFFAQSINPDADGRTQLLSLIKAYIAFYREQPGYYHLLGSGEDEIEALQMPLGDQSRDALSFVAAAIAKGRRDGSVALAEQNDTLAALLLWSCAHGCIDIADRRARILREHWNIEPDALLDAATALLLGAVSADKPAA